MLAARGAATFTELCDPGEADDACKMAKQQQMKRANQHAPEARLRTHGMRANVLPVDLGDPGR